MYTPIFIKKDIFNKNPNKNLLDLVENAVSFGYVAQFHEILEGYWDLRSDMRHKMMSNISFMDSHIRRMQDAADNIREQFCCFRSQEHLLPLRLANACIENINDRLEYAGELNARENFNNALGFYDDLDDRSLIDRFYHRFTPGTPAKTLRKELTREVVTDIAGKIESRLMKNRKSFDRLYWMSIRHNMYTIHQVFIKSYSL
jgi:hypothetical protein